MLTRELARTPYAYIVKLLPLKKADTVGDDMEVFDRVFDDIGTTRARVISVFDNYAAAADLMNALTGVRAFSYIEFYCGGEYPDLVEFRVVRA